MINQKSVDFKAGSLILGSVFLYAIIVVYISPVTFLEFIPFLVSYTKILLIIFIVFSFIKFIFEIIILGIKTKFKASPFIFLHKEVKEKWKQDRFISVIWPLLTIIILIPSFNVFKQTILSKKAFATDTFLAKLDYFIFQENPGLILHELIGSQETTIMIDNIYQSWFLPMILGVFLVSMCRNPILRLRYMSCYVFSWIFIGAVLAYLLPSAGPCFYVDFIDQNHNDYAQLMKQLHFHQTQPPIKALVYQQYLSDVFGKNALTIGGGISAMPSVHMALATLFALGSFSYNRKLGLLMTAYALLIWLGSVYLAWHYFVDGLVSVILVILFWKLHSIFEKKHQK